MSPKTLEVILTQSGYLPAEPNQIEEAETRKIIQRTSRKLHGRYLTALMWLANALRILQEGWE